MVSVESQFSLLKSAQEHPHLDASYTWGPQNANMVSPQITYIYNKKKLALNLVFFCTCLLENSASNIPIIPQKITPHQGAVVSAGHDAEGTAMRRCPGRVDSPNRVIAAIKKKTMETKPYWC